MAQANRTKATHYLYTGNATTKDAVIADLQNFKLIGEGFTSFSVDMGAEEEDFQYINQKSATTVLKKYKPQASLSGIVVGSVTNEEIYTLDPVFAYIDDIRLKRKIPAETYLLNVYSYSATTYDSSSNKLEDCKSELQKVNISLGSFGGDAGDTLSFEATINYDGEADISYKFDVVNDSSRAINLHQ